MKYIDADKLIADIESIINSDHPIEYDLMEKRAYNSALSDVINLITSLQQEQPEADIKKELHAYICSDEYMNTREDGSLLIARHFYELGLKARKEK